MPMLAFGQTDIQMSQHMFNRATYNPASTGASRYINIYGHWRDQWQGFSNAPQTMFLTINSYFPDLKSGLGVVAIKDKIGFERNILFKLSYAYHIHFNSSSYLSLGLSAGLLDRYIDWTQSILGEHDSDYVIPKEPENRTVADFDFGAEYNLERFTLGLSVTHLNRRADKTLYNTMGQHFYGYVKYKFGLNMDFDLVPALFVQNSNKSMHMESNLVLFYRNKAWIGASYRVDDKFESEAVVGILGLDLFDFLRISYSFDYNTGKIGRYSNNTHELMLGIRIERPQKIYTKSPRFFE
jgi:type IX secretion system PorP/SprF family membrane protein